MSASPRLAGLVVTLLALLTGLSTAAADPIVVASGPVVLPLTASQSTSPRTVAVARCGRFRAAGL